MAATDDLTAELIKFNAFLAVEDDRERQVRAERKAAKEREAAAVVLKKVMADSGASKDDKDAAEQAWKDAVATEERVKAGEPAEPTPADEPEGDAATRADAHAEVDATDTAPAAEPEGDAAAEPEPAAAEGAEAEPTPEPEPIEAAAEPATEPEPIEAAAEPATEPDAS